MAYQFTAEEIARIQAARLLSPAGDTVPTATGNWRLFYTELSSIIEGRIEDGTVTGVDLQDLKNAKLWLDVARGANSGIGIHSEFIRAFTNRQGLLRRGSEFSDAEMQYSSNGVALNLWRNLADPDNISLPEERWLLPSISDIAELDAGSIGDNLYGIGSLGQQLPDLNDTAITANAGWSGTLGFNLLGGSAPFESWRLLVGGDGGAATESAVNTLDDFKNILFAVDAYQYALGRNSDSVFESLTNTIELFGDEIYPFGEEFDPDGLLAQANIGLASGDWLGFIKDVAGRSPVIAPVVNLIVDVGSDRFLDMLRGAIAGEVKIGETNNANFASNVHAFFTGLTAAQLQSTQAILPSSAVELGELALTDVNARAALSSMSLVSVEVGQDVAVRFSLYDEKTGEGEITQSWIADRTEALGFYSEYWKRGGTSGVLAAPVGLLPVIGDTIISDEGLGSSQELTINGFDFGVIEPRYLRFGDSTVNNLEGGGSDDRIYGQGGNDILAGNGGNDYLEGGKGIDTYIHNTGDDLDTIFDKDGTNILQVSGMTLTGGERIAGDLWRDENQGIDYQLTTHTDGTQVLTITRDGEGTVLRIEEYQPGSFGLTFTDPAVVMPPPVVNTIVGDFEPMEFLDTNGNPFYQNDSLGNPIQDFSKPAPLADALNGSEDNDLIQSGELDDWVNAKGGDDTVEMGTGEDFADGGEGNDSISGGEGSDVLAGGGGQDWIDAEEGQTADSALLADQSLAQRGDLLSGGSDADVMLGSAAQDTMLGGEGGDVMVGSAGDDNLVGDAALSAADLNWTTTRSVNQGIYSLTYGFGVIQDTVGGADVLFGGAGDDWVFGALGDDFLDGGTGDDALFGGEGKDSLLGGEGSDLLAGDSDELDGALHDTDYLDGGADADTLLGGGGADRLFGGDGDDILVGDSDSLAAIYHGDDVLHGGAGNDELQGNEGNDELNGDAGQDILFGGKGEDSLSGGEDNDQLQGGAGHDQLDGGAGSDILLGEAGDDLIVGGDGNDLLFGQEGTDVLLGGADNDELQGGDGDDTLAGGTGNDQLYGEAGSDTFEFGLGDGNDSAIDADGTDNVQFGAGITPESLSIVIRDDSLFIQVSETDSLTVTTISGGISQYLFADGSALTTETLLASAQVRMDVSGSDGDDTFSGTTGDDSILSLGGDDTLDGGSGDDTLDGGEGNDLITGGVGNDQLLGGGGNDTFVVSGNDDGFDIIDGGDGFDVIQGSAQDDVVGLQGFSAGAVDFIDGGGGYNGIQGDITGGIYNFSLTSFQSINYINTGGGNDAITTNSVAGIALQGGSGDDTLTVQGNWNSGQTRLEGGTDSDTYRVSSPVIISDTGGGNDRVVFEGLNGVSGWTLTEFNNAPVSRNYKDLLIYRNDTDLSNGENPAVTIENWFTGSDSIERFELADGTALNAQDFVNRIPRFEAGNQEILIKDYDTRDLQKPVYRTYVGYDGGASPDGLYSGSTLSSAGDVNGDGFDDFLVSATAETIVDTYYGGYSEAYTGRSFLVLGEGFSGYAGQETDLNGSTSNGIVEIQKPDGNENRLGQSLAGLGDVNGDGFNDILVTAPGAGGDSYGGSYYGGGGYSNSPIGEAYVVFGSDSMPASIDVSALDGQNGFVINAQNQDQWSSAAGVGDINGDGLSDVLVTLGDNDTSHVIFGSDQGFSAAFDTTTLDGSNGFSLTGVDSLQLSDAGDVNGDGLNDFIINGEVDSTSAYSQTPTAFVIYGQSQPFNAQYDLTQLQSGQGFSVAGFDTYASVVVDSLGDINGDGFADLAMNTKSSYGSITGTQIVFGSADGGNIDVGTMTASDGIALNGVSARNAGDFNGDGRDDLLISTGIEQSVYIVFGGVDLSSMALNNLTDQEGVRITPEVLQEDFGYALTAVGDTNGDGFDDVLVSAPESYVYTPYNTQLGRSYLIYGQGSARELEYTGVDADDVIGGDDQANVVTGLAGNDQLSGGLGNDEIVGGSGDDQLSGGGGDDLLIGGADNDTLDGGAGNDILRGAAGDDQLVYDMDTVIADGGRGVDTLQVTGADRLLVFSDSSSPDAVTGISNIEVIDLTGQGANSAQLDQASVLQLSDTSNTLRIVGNADDTLAVNNLTDWSTLPDVTLDGQLYRQYGNGQALMQVAVAVTVTDATTSTDFVPPAPTLEGGSGYDTLPGTTGDDVIASGAGNDTVFGYEGNDVLIGGAGQDTLDGGSGNDTFYIEGSDTAFDTFIGDTGNDLIVGSAGDDTIRLRSFDAGNSVEAIDGGAGTNVIAGTSGYDTIDLSATAISNIDHIEGGAGNDTITGTGGADLIDGGTGQDVLNGGGGDDTFTVNGTDSKFDTFNGGTGTDTVLGGDADDTIRLRSFDAGNSVEAIDGGAGTNVIAGTSGYDTIDLSATAVSNIDRIEGGAGNDAITGTDGADVISGDTGTDALNGGVGDDRYLFDRGDGRDGIADFDATPNNDTLQLGSGIRHDQLWFSQVGNDLSIEVIGTSDEVVVDNWFAGAEYQLETLESGDGLTLLNTQVDQLVQAMAAFAPPASGELDLSPELQSQLEPVLTANWQ